MSIAAFAERRDHWAPGQPTPKTLTIIFGFQQCGVFPPLQIANQIFSKGTAGGSPGTEWEPFTLSEDEYAALVEAVKKTPVSEITYARYAFLPMKFDHPFDDISEWQIWFGAVCKKHREDWHAALKKAGAMS
jgi:hypothetical protein